MSELVVCARFAASIPFSTAGFLLCVMGICLDVAGNKLYRVAEKIRGPL